MDAGKYGDSNWGEDYTNFVSFNEVLHMASGFDTDTTTSVVVRSYVSLTSTSAILPSSDIEVKPRNLGDFSITQTPQCTLVWRQP